MNQRPNGCAKGSEGGMNMYENCEMKMHPVQSETPRETMASVINQTQATLKELLIMIDDTSMQLFSKGLIDGDPLNNPDSKCVFDDVSIVRNQANMALCSFGELRKKLI